MTRSTIHAGASWFLSVLLLLPNGGVSEIRHSHEGGDKPHDHSHTVQQHHSEDDHQSAGHPACGLEIDSCVAHIHISWLGFEFSIPATSGTDGSDHNSNGLTTAAFLPSLCDSIMDGPAWIADCAFQFVAVESICIESQIVPQTLPQCSIMPVVGTPLCDTARHERSGVQLA